MTAWAPGAGASSRGAASYGQQPSPFDQTPFEGAPRERVPFGREALLDLAVRASVAPEDEAAGIAEGARVTRRAEAAGSAAAGGVIHGRWGRGRVGVGVELDVVASDSSPPRRPGRKRAIWPRKKTAAATIVAIAPWMIRLPEPGSMYASSKPNMSLLTAPTGARYGRLADRQRDVSGHVSAEVLIAHPLGLRSRRVRGVADSGRRRRRTPGDRSPYGPRSASSASAS